MQITEKIALLARSTQVSFTLCPNNGEPAMHFGVLPDFGRWIAPITIQFSPDKDVECLFTNSLMFISHIRYKDGDIYIGPTSSIKCDPFRVKNLLNQYHLPMDMLNASIQYFDQTGPVSMGRFLDITILAYNLATGLRADTKELTLHGASDDHRQYEVPKLNPVEELHDGRELEIKLFSQIQFGNPVEKVFDLTHAGIVNEGTLSFSPLNHRRYLMISSVAIAARYAVSGGMDYSLAMSIADGYIQLLDRANDLNTMIDIANDMFRTYSHMVSELKLNFPQSGTVYKIQKAIASHLEEKITVQSIADELGLSRTFISSHFKATTGKNLNDYINEQKINRAKVLLKTTKMPIIDISDLLSFSSQSYFQAVFKKQTGMTPNEYRQEHLKPFEL